MYKKLDDKQILDNYFVLEKVLDNGLIITMYRSKKELAEVIHLFRTERDGGFGSTGN